MKKYVKGGLEGIIAAVIVVGIIVALIIGTVIPMTNTGEELIGATTNELANQQTTIGPK